MDLLMKTDLTPNQTAFYRENGFLVIPDFLTTEELNAWRENVDEAVARRDGRRLAKSDERSGDSYYDNVFIQRVNLWQDHEGMRELMLDAHLGKLAAALAGVDGIRIWHDQALIKQPWGNPTAWHLDNPYWSFSSRDAISIWVALDDATLENGCLYFMPGTHKLATYDNVGIGQNMGDLFKVYTDWSKRNTVAAPMKAGSCSFHNGLVAHGAGANMTPGFRRAMTCAYMPDGSTFNGLQNILTDEQISRLKLGDTLADDTQNPLIYHVSKSYVSRSQT
jgi:phytanoyl-CoA hydroxylase